MNWYTMTHSELAIGRRLCPYFGLESKKLFPLRSPSWDGKLFDVPVRWLVILWLGMVGYRMDPNDRREPPVSSCGQSYACAQTPP